MLQERKKGVWFIVGFVKGNAKKTNLRSVCDGQRHLDRGRALWERPAIRHVDAVQAARIGDSAAAGTA